MSEETRPDDVAVQLIRWIEEEGRDAGIDLACGDCGATASAGPDQPDLVVRLPGCLAQLPTHIPVELLAAAPMIRVRLRVAECPRDAEVRYRFGPVVELLPGRLSLVEVATAPDAEPTDRAEHPGAPRVLDVDRLPGWRRALLGQPAKTTLPDVSATGHARLGAALRALLPDGPSAGADARAPGIRLRVRPRPGDSGVVAANGTDGGPGCTACLTCVRSCPEAALAMPVSGAVARLLQRPVACSGCGECIAACPEDVLVADRQLRWRDQLGPDAAYPLVAVTTRVCARCGARFPDGPGEHCAVCTFRIAHPFGSRLPPRAEALRQRAVTGESGLGHNQTKP